MASGQRFPNAPEFASAREIGGVVDAKGGYSANVVRLGAGLRQNGDDVLERLLELRNEFVALEFLVGISANLAGDEHDAAGRHADAVGIADRRRPAGWKENPHRHQRTVRKVPRTALRSSLAS